MKTDLVQSVRTAFEQHYPDSESPLLISSPGRINLIGEHTDYNEGFVLPAAIDRTLILAIARNGLPRIRLTALDMEQQSFDTELEPLINDPDAIQKSGLGWPDYILGCLQQLLRTVDGERLEGFDLVFSGSIPVGAGLSSSAALETGTLVALDELFGLNRSRLHIAQMARNAEREFVGVQCGIMDQFANLFGKAGHVIRIDCRSLEYSYHPFDSNEYSILLCDTGVRRELAASEYNRRRQECNESLRRISQLHPDINSLRDLSPENLRESALVQRLGPVLYKRCRYVVEENRRVVDACDALESGDMSRLGQCMNRSHLGLRDDYEVSCMELDLLAESAWQIDGVAGARMMGGGFGGCTINVVETDKLPEVQSRLSQIYLNVTGREPEMHLTTIGGGTDLVSFE